MNPTREQIIRDLDVLSAGLGLNEDRMIREARYIPYMDQVERQMQVEGVGEDERGRVAEEFVICTINAAPRIPDGDREILRIVLNTNSQGRNKTERNQVLASFLNLSVRTLERRGDVENAVGRLAHALRAMSYWPCLDSEPAPQPHKQIEAGNLSLLSSWLMYQTAYPSVDIASREFRKEMEKLPNFVSKLPVEITETLEMLNIAAQYAIQDKYQKGMVLLWTGKSDQGVLLEEMASVLVRTHIYGDRRSMRKLRNQLYAKLNAVFRDSTAKYPGLFNAGHRLTGGVGGAIDRTLSMVDARIAYLESRNLWDPEALRGVAEREQLTVSQMGSVDGDEETGTATDVE